MRTPLFYAESRLGADKLSAELLTFTVAFCRVIGGRENQIPVNATLIENSAGYSYGKIAFRGRGSAPKW